MMNDEARQVFGLPLGDWLASFTSPRYLPMGLALYLAMFTSLKFVLLLFNATDTLDRATFELTPAFLLNLPDLQLLFFGAIATGVEAYLQYRTDARSRYLGMGVAGLLAAGLVLGLYDAGADPTGSNAMRLVTLGVVLAIVVLDHFSILAEAEVPTPEAAEEAAGEAPVAAGTAPRRVDIDADVDESLAEIQRATAEAPVRPVEAEIAELEALAREAVVEVEEEEKEEEEEAEQGAEFAIKELDAFETWLDNKEKIEEETRKKAAERKARQAKKP